MRNTNPYTKLLPKIRLSEKSKRPRDDDERMDLIEREIRDLRGVLRELVTTLERATGRDLDGDRVVGRVGANRPMGKMPRLTRPLRQGRSDGLPMNIP